MDIGEGSKALTTEQIDLYRDVFDNVPTGIYRTTPDGLILLANPALIKMLGYSSFEELASRNLEQEFEPRYSRGHFKDQLERKGEVRGLESEWLRCDGLVIYVRETAKAIRGPSGEVLYYEGTVEDVSGQVRAEQRLSYAEALKETILDTALDAIVAMDHRGQIVEFNPAAEKMFGYQRSEAIGREMADLIIPARLRESHRKGLAHFLATGEGPILGRRVEISAVRSDDSEFPVELDVHRVPLGTSIMFTGHIRDITEHKQAQATLAEKNRELAGALAVAKEATQLKSEFVANISHEIRTPMNGVIGMTELLLDTSLTPEQRECAETARESANALLQVINDILDFSKIEAGKLTLETIDFDLTVLVRRIHSLFAEPARRNGMEVVCGVPESVPERVRGDPMRLRQVLLNLVGNAIKFTERGRVDLQLVVEEASDRSVTIRFAVTDTGIGIPEEVQDRIFESFAQADGSMTRKYGGTGLGLSISQQLVAMMGGQLRVESTTGRGSTFWFVLPFERS